MLRGFGPLMRSAHAEPSVAVTAAASALAVGAGLGPRSALVALAVGAGQLSIGWSNDWLDRDRDAASRRTDKPLAQREIAPRAVMTAAFVALLVCVVASVALGPASAVVHLIAVSAGWWYNVQAKHTAYSVVPWALAFGLLPAVVTLARPLVRWPAWWLLVAGGLLGAGAHFANALPDIEEDRHTGVDGLPQRLGRRRSVTAATVLVAGGVALVALGTRPRPAGVAIGVVGAVGLLWVGFTSWRGRDRLAFRGIVALLLLLAVGVVTSGAALF